MRSVPLSAVFFPVIGSVGSITNHVLGVYSSYGFIAILVSFQYYFTITGFGGVDMVVSIFLL